MGHLIDSLEVEAAAVADATFAPIKAAHDIKDEVTFVDNAVSLPWITSGCSNRPAVDAILAGLCLNLALGEGFKWWERVSSGSNLADKPSRGLVPDCPLGWQLWDLAGVGRWVPGIGPGPPRSKCVHKACTTLRPTVAFSVWDARGVWETLGCTLGWVPPVAPPVAS